MKVKELIEALESCDEDAVVCTALDSIDPDHVPEDVPIIAYVVEKKGTATTTPMVYIG